MPVRYGHFDDDRREYVITRPDTPLPWINYLGTEAFFGIISNTAGGYSFYRDARLRRITRYRYNNVPADTGGRYLYLRDNASGDVLVPVVAAYPAETRRLRVPARPFLHPDLLGLSRAFARRPCTSCRSARRSRSGGCGSATSGTSRPGCRCSPRSSSACGTRRTTRRTSSATTRPARSRSRSTASSTTRPSTGNGAITSPTSPAPSRWPGSTRSGRRSSAPYRGWDRPLAVERGESGDSIAHGWPPLGSHHVRLTLAPGETREVIFVLGYQENPPDAKFDPPGSGVLSKGRSAAGRSAGGYGRPTVADGFERLRESWDGAAGHAAGGHPGRRTPTGW